MDKKKVVIIGAGFAGLNLAKRLDRKKFSVEIIDRNNFHSFPPLFYQIASSGLDADDISFPVRRELRHLSDTSFHMGHISEVDPVSKTVTTDKKKTGYDILVIAAGSVNNYFGNEKLAHSAFGIKTVNEAMRTRDQILENLEKASLCGDPRRRRQLLTFMVVGGGPTGVEIAGALGEMKKYVIPREYPELDPGDVSIKLMEGSDRILGAMGGKCSEHARRDLESLLVEVKTGTIIKDYSDKTVTFADGSTEYCETIIWSAGIKGADIPGLDKSCIGHGGRILTDRYHRVEGYDGILRDRRHRAYPEPRVAGRRSADSSGSHTACPEPRPQPQSSRQSQAILLLRQRLDGDNRQASCRGQPMRIPFCRIPRMDSVDDRASDVAHGNEKQIPCAHQLDMELFLLFQCYKAYSRTHKISPPASVGRLTLEIFC